MYGICAKIPRYALRATGAGAILSPRRRPRVYLDLRRAGTTGVSLRFSTRRLRTSVVLLVPRIRRHVVHDRKYARVRDASLDRDPRSRFARVIYARFFGSLETRMSATMPLFEHFFNLFLDIVPIGRDSSTASTRVSDIHAVEIEDRRFDVARSNTSIARARGHYPCVHRIYTVIGQEFNSLLSLSIFFTALCS